MAAAAHECKRGTPMHSVGSKGQDSGWVQEESLEQDVSCLAQAPKTGMLQLMEGAKLFLGLARCPATPQGRRGCTRNLQDNDIDPNEQEPMPPRVEAMAEQPLSSGSNIFYDVIGDVGGQPVLLPIESAEPRIAVRDLPADAVVNIRVVRFFEDRDDEKCPWEKRLQNVNSGSLLWLPVHLMPKTHSVHGCKYGGWFTVHYIRLNAKFLKSGYHMCKEGVSLAKTFGATSGVSTLITGKILQNGYFWFVSPSKGSADDENCLLVHGWQHLRREGPFDGNTFLSEWRKQGSPMEEAHIQQVLQLVQHSSL